MTLADKDDPEAEYKKIMVTLQERIKEINDYLKDKLLHLAMELDLDGEIPKHRIALEIVKHLKRFKDERIISTSWIVNSLPHEYTLDAAKVKSS
jgi:hypothetical protein